MNQAIGVIRVLEAAGFTAFMVGGAVRDFLLGKIPHDIDVATSAAPDQVKALFKRTVDTGIEHGTVLVLVDGEGIEVTTYRTEGGYTDSRRPDSVEFVQSIEEDLKRRDFTINAMAMGENLQIIDPYGGRADLADGLIRAVGEPTERFGEDALRMLRAVRFAGQLDFSIDDATLRAIQTQAPSISRIAVERLKNELDKIMESAHIERSMAYLQESNLTSYLPSGELFNMDWSAFKRSGVSLNGWVYMLYKQRKDFEGIRIYRFSNDDKTFINRTLEAARTQQWDSWTFYNYTEQQLLLAAELKELDVDPAAMKERLPIASKADMAVNGLDLISWSGAKRGPWLKHWLDKIEHELVFGRLENDKNIIKEWFMDEYHSHE